MELHRLFRFQIRGVLALMALVAIGLGLWIYDRQSRIGRAKALVEQGIGVLATSDAPGFVAETSRSNVPFVRPALAEIYVYLGLDGSVRMDDELIPPAEVNTAILKKRDTVHSAGIKNVHLQFVAYDCSVDRFMVSTEGRETILRLMKFGNEHGFASNGFLEADQVAERKRNLDPKGVVRRSSD